MAQSPNSVHCLTVDVEDYFQVAAFRNSVSRDQWDSLPSRVAENTGKVLDLFADLGVKGTFFVLGWVAERFPKIVRRIAEAGHELGCHSYWHRLIYELSPEEFREDTLRALDAIQQASGVRVTYYRAPSFSVVRRSLWALDILLESGITHDSSIFPVRHDLYGIPGAPAEPFAIKRTAGQLIEFPPSTVKLWRLSLPATGGGYLRILPLVYQKRALRALEMNNIPAMIYLHPWELDPEQPRIAASLRSRFRHYTGLAATAGRIRNLSCSFRLVPMSQALPVELPVFELHPTGKFHACDGMVSTRGFEQHVQAGSSLCR